MCGLNTLSVQLVSAPVGTTISQSLIDSFNLAMTEFINNNDTTLAYSGTSMTYTINVNSSYYSAS